MTQLFKKFLGINWVLFANMMALLVFGVYAIYNASAHEQEPGLALKWRDQINWAIIGFPFMFGAALIDYRWVRWAAWGMYAAGIAGLILLKFYGVEIQGNTNWLRIGGFSFQPSQLAIMSGVLVLAVVFGELPRHFPIFRYPSLRLLLGGLLAAFPAALVFKEDYGSGLVWGPVFLAMMLVGSIPMRYIIVLAEVVLCVVPIVYFFGLKPYQKERINTTWYMLTNQHNKVNIQREGWVANFVEIAVGSAGFEGKGPLSAKVPDRRSVHRTFFPDESINDFIFAVVAEEFGFRGSLLLLSGMAMLLLQCVFVAFYARDQTGRLIVVGVTAMMFVHTFQNAGMNLNMLPIIGLPMPFVSYGGTFLLVTLFMMGMVQSVWVHRNISPVKRKAGGYADEEPGED